MRTHSTMLSLGTFIMTYAMVLSPSPVLCRASSSFFGQRRSSLDTTSRSALHHNSNHHSLVVMAPTSASRQATLSRRVQGYLHKHNQQQQQQQRGRRTLITSNQFYSSPSAVLLASTRTQKSKSSSKTNPLAEEQASLLDTSSSPLKSALEEPPSFSDLSLFGKFVAGITEMTLVCVFDYLSGFAMAYAAGAVFGVPKFFQQQTLKQWHGRNRKWGHSWGSISAVVGGTNVAARVVRGGKEDEWTSVLSSMAMGAYWRRTQGPKAMIQGALTYGAIIYFLSAGSSPKRRGGVSETTLLDGDETVVDF